MAESQPLQYVPFSSSLDAGFWYQLTQKKLDVYKLQEEPIDIFGFYTCGGAQGLGPIANVDYTSFNEDIQVPPNAFMLQGTLLNTNTLEEFKKKDKQDLIQSVAEKIWKSIQNGSALNDPFLLQQMLCLTFADLKKYHYYYWLAFPSFLYPDIFSGPPQKINTYFDERQLPQLLKMYNSLSMPMKSSFFVHVSIEGDITMHPLKNYKAISDSPGQIFLGFSDPSTLPNHPGWPLRNLLTLLAVKWSSVNRFWNVICFRDNLQSSSRNTSNSIVLAVQIKDMPIPEACPKAIGWEKNNGKLLPRKVDMSSDMDPIKLADSAVDLNLKLMRWRLLPELDLDAIKFAKCLLLGAGTLGCNVARCLMSWGVRKITFVDNSNVSYSNPVRQTLFQFEDCLQGGKPKALAAAEALKKIFPGVDSEGKVLSIPMPGHSLSSNALQATTEEVRQLEQLIESHDVVFLLMDTRESRWLPTVIGAVKNKIVINAALGFDTYLVMRHGVRLEGQVSSNSGSSSSSIPGSELGCYFCNDIVAPGNSTMDRTLDQQCTVTRPGVSYMAASIAVEMLVSILQHPQKANAPSIPDINSASFEDQAMTMLGVIPHQIRGYINKYQNVLHVNKAFDRCTACSSQVLQKYETEGLKFLVKVFDEPNYLEDLTGLTELLNDVNIEEIYELSDNDSI